MRRGLYHDASMSPSPAAPSQPGLPVPPTPPLQPVTVPDASTLHWASLGPPDVEVVRWLASEGEAILAGQALVALDTDKVSVELAAPSAGVLRGPLTAPGTIVRPGDRLADIEPVDQVPEAPLARSPDQGSDEDDRLQPARQGAAPLGFTEGLMTGILLAAGLGALLWNLA